MKITQQELIEFADENDLQIFGNSTVIISKIRAIQRLVNKGLIPKPVREGGAPSYWKNDTEIKDRIIWLDEQKKQGVSYRKMKEDLAPQKHYSPEEMVVKDMVLSANDLLKINPNALEIMYLKARMLNTIGEMEEALELLKLLEEKCKNNKKLLMLVYDEMAFMYQRFDEKEQGLIVCQKLISVAQESGDNRKLGSAYCDMGSYFCSYGNIEEAFECYNRAIFLLEGTDGLGDAYGGMHWVQVQKGNLSEAETYLKKSIEIFARTGNERKESISLANLGMLYFDLDRLTEALDIMREAYYAVSRLHDLYGMAKISSNIGNVYMKKGLFSKAMEHLRHAYQLAHQINNQPLQALCLERMSEVYNEMGNSKKSEFYLKESKRIKENIPDSEENNENQSVPDSAEQNDTLHISTRDD